MNGSVHLYQGYLTTKQLPTNPPQEKARGFFPPFPLSQFMFYALFWLRGLNNRNYHPPSNMREGKDGSRDAPGPVRLPVGWVADPSPPPAPLVEGPEGEALPACMGAWDAWLHGMHEAQHGWVQGQRVGGWLCGLQAWVHGAGRCLGAWAHGFMGFAVKAVYNRHPQILYTDIHTVMNAQPLYIMPLSNDFLE